MKNLLVGVSLLSLLSASLGCSAFIAGLGSYAPEEGSRSAARLTQGPHDFSRRDFEFLDGSRGTMANGDFPASASRKLAVSVWSPESVAGARPLVFYSHGFTGEREGMLFLVEHLASHGYGVAAVDFPLTHGEAPGGPNFLDLRNQPGDVRFVLDSLLALNEQELGFSVDADRIGLMGLSYGGLTTTLLAFHPSERDPRIRGAVSIAGPSQMFTERFFAGDGPPFLMVAGTEDALVPHAANAAPIPSMRPGAATLSLEGGTHLGFVEFARFWLRFSHNPDSMACGGIRDQVEAGTSSNQEGDPFEGLGGPELGIDPTLWQLPCADTSHEFVLAMRPHRQQVITSLAVRAFFDSLFAPAAPDRNAAATYLQSTLPSEFQDVIYTRKE